LTLGSLMLLPGEVSLGIRVDKWLLSELGGRPAPDHGMLSRPINMGSTYMTRPSSYNISGNVHSGAGLENIANYIGTMTGQGAAGSIRINDSRRPITRSYVDRLMGEY